MVARPGVQFPGQNLYFKVCHTSFPVLQGTAWEPDCCSPPRRASTVHGQAKDHIQLYWSLVTPLGLQVGSDRPI
ncbi:hypothetical protein HaLaN_19677, partial [Haematococcus lacustris]